MAALRKAVLKQILSKIVLPGTLIVVLPGCSGPRGPTYQGYVEGEFVYMASSQPGHLEHLAVTRGAQVARGAELFALEAIEEKAEQHQAQQQLAAAEAQLADIQTGKRPPEMAVIRAQLLQAQAAARKSAQQRERDEAQYRAGGISREQLEATLAQASSDAAHVNELASQLDVARLPGREQQLQAQNNQVLAARAVLAQADWRVDQKSVSAPGAGLVFDTMYREGEWVAAGSPVVRMLPPQNIKVRFFVPQPALGTLAVGQKVSLHCDGCAADIPATITFISTEAEYTPPVIYSNETRSKLIFMIEAHPTPEDAVKLHPGQPLAVRPQ
ncbi:MAG TPA: HlyD family efflux transporter periplasmic adaptor subunit [Steroidobacteraceae bacterium]|nr:HlyD family efflux transporter periplasmic adaptor subunit [Steroidobacteraceae bacterium]